MATLTIEIPDTLKEQLDREIASGRFKDSSALVQALLEAAIRTKWRGDADRKLDDALNEVERGEVTPWKTGDAVTLGQEYLRTKRAREGKA